MDVPKQSPIGTVSSSKPFGVLGPHGVHPLWSQLQPAGLEEARDGHGHDNGETFLDKYDNYNQYTEYTLTLTS